MYTADTAGPRNGITNYFVAEMVIPPGTGARGAPGLERFITNDGTLFIVCNIKYGTIQKLPATRLTAKTYVDIRNWYYTLTKTLHDHGLYVHPFWAFRVSCTHK